MDIGTIETIDEAEEPKKRRVGTLGGSNAPGGDGGGFDDGDGGDDVGDRSSGRTQPFNAQKSRVFTFFLLIAIVMTFGGVIAAYVVLQANKAAEWRPFELPVQVWVSTLIIVISSVTYELAKRALILNRHDAAKRWLIGTTALGAAFISSQVLAWLALAARGMYLRGNPYAGFFYMLTALHAVHVLGGVIALGSILLRSWRPAARGEAVFQRVALARVVGWYWHFMGGLWLVLFVLLGFWK